jgi:hypothetical protein
MATTDLRAHLTDEIQKLRLAKVLTSEELADRLLSLPGIAIVELPEPESSTDTHDHQVWHFPHYISGWNGEFPGVMDCDAEMDPSVARSIAAALLAAANKAEATP